MSEAVPGCELCHGAGGAVLWQNSLCRVVAVDEPGLPGFLRVVLARHVREMTDLPPADRERLMAMEQQQCVNLSSETRYDLIAQNLGWYAEKVDGMRELPSDLQRADDSGKPALLHVTVDASINADPPGYKQFRYVRTL